MSLVETVNAKMSNGLISAGVVRNVKVSGFTHAPEPLESFTSPSCCLTA